MIKYCLPEEVRIKMEIFDSREEKIQVLVDEIKESGTYQVEFNANNLSSGVYFYQLRVGDPSTSAGHSLVETKEMILIK